MKYTAKVLSIAIAVLYVLAMVLLIGLLFFRTGDGYSSSLVNSEVVYVMLALWIAVPLGLMALTAAFIKTVKPSTRRSRRIKASTYLSGAFIIGAALLLTVLLIMTALGLLNPRRTQLTLITPDKSLTYNGSVLVGSEPEISSGQLHEGHYLEVLSVPQYIEVGKYSNAPQYRILDDTGADVTNQYDITQEFGLLTVAKRKITLSSPRKTKLYDGKPLVADAVTLTNGSLVKGHKLHASVGNSITLPGTEVITAHYRILAEDGTDMTAQYEVREDVGTLTVKALDITIATDSASKIYDGTALTASGWKQTAGTLLTGHKLEMTIFASRKDVGTVNNEGTARVVDANGNNVSHLYNIEYQFGTLKVQPIALYVRTGSGQKVYDGKPLQVTDWQLTRGQLEEGCEIQVKRYPSQTQVGSLENAIEFLVVDRNGKDVTDRYIFVGDYGTLTVQPRAISIRTGSAEKVYDGKPLSCNSYEIISGSLHSGDRIELTCVSVTDVGYCENYVLNCTILRIEENGAVMDVTAYYRITIDFGTLKITAN